MQRYHIFSFIFFISTMLSACGGGGSGGDDSAGVSPANFDDAYTGKRDPALLTKNNAMPFVEMLLGGSDLFGGDNFSKSSHLPEDSSAYGLIGVNNSLHKHIKAVYQRSTYQQKQVDIDESEACEYGGKESLTGSIDDSSGKGTLAHKYTNCKVEKDLVLNGSMTLDIRVFDVEQYDWPTSYIGTFNDLSIKDGSSIAVFSGTVDYKHNLNSAVVTQKINLFAKEASTGEQRVLKNVTLVNDLGDAITKVSGKLFIDEYGYVDVLSSNGLILWDIIEGGEIVLKGASKSAAKVSAYDSGYEGKYRVDLDVNGDGVYELTSVQSLLSDNPVVPTSNKAPVVDVEYQQPWSEDGFILGDEIYLSAYDSYDPEGDQLEYVWSVEEKPEGSSLKISGSNTGEEASTTTFDKLGNYKFSLKLTDLAGKTAIGFVEVNLQDNPPAIDEIYIQGTYTDDENKLEVNESVTAEAYVTDDYDTNSELVYSWELQKPANSNAVLEDNVNETTTFTPDIIGQYKVILTLTDFSGGVDIAEQAITVIHTPPTAGIWISGGNLIQIGEELQLDGFGSHSVTSDDLSYLWKVKSAPQGSSATFSPDARSEFVSITPDKIGTYQFSLTVTDDYGASSTVYKNVSVVAAQ